MTDHALPLCAAAAAVGTRAPDDPGMIVVRDLTKAYGRSRVLDVPYLAIPGGMLTAVVGGNGAGKSTLLGCLAGIMRHGGSIEFGRRRGGIGSGSGGPRVAFLPQRLRLPGAATVEEVLTLFRALAGGGPDRVVAPEGFVPPGHRRIGELSGGQAQRLALAATLLGAPDLLLLDEPSANLDDHARVQVRDLIKAHRDAGASVLIASPAAFELIADADHVVQVEGGKVAFEGTSTAYIAELRSTVWVALDPDDAAWTLGDLALVERTRIVGRWVALACRGHDVTTIVRMLGDRGVGPERIRVAGSANAVGGPPPPGAAATPRTPGFGRVPGSDAAPESHV